MSKCAFVLVGCLACTLGWPGATEAKQLDRAGTSRLIKEIDRLSALARAERRTSSLLVTPSARIAFYLLTGLAKTHPVVRVTPTLRARLGISRSPIVMLRVSKLNSTTSVVCTDTPIQDKAMHYTSHHCSLMIRVGSRWTKRGGGSAATVTP